MSEQQPRSTEEEEENPSLSSILLPDELIVAILLRLPVTSLLRFKSVSKSWFSVISDPQFAKSHFDLAASPTHRLLLHCTPQLQFHSLDIHSSPPNHESALLKYLRQEFDDGYGIDIDFHPKLEVLGSCRGFLLLLSHNFPADDYDFIVCNPSTGEHRLIPSSTSFSYSWRSQYGIGYDQSTDDYLLVSINSFRRDPGPTIDLFSLKTNLPCSLTLDHEYQHNDSASPTDLFLHGSLHWLVMSSLTKLPVVLAFDLVGKSLSQIALSPDLALELKKKTYHLREMTGCLGLCPDLCFSGNLGMIEIWIMKEYKVPSSWTKIVFYTHDIYATHRFLPICFTKYGDVFGSDEDGRFLRVNHKGKLLAVWPSDRKSYYRLLHSRMYTASLLSLPT